MSDPMEPPPWAFDDCTAWTLFETKIEAVGLILKQRASWRLDDNDATRGDTMRRFDVVAGGSMARLFSVVVEARAAAGFTLWIEASAVRRGDIFETVLRIAQQCQKSQNAR